MKRSPLARKGAAVQPAVKRLYVKKGINGVSRIVRDSYGPNWYAKVDEIQGRDGRCCLDCGSKQHLHTHHIRPLNKGGLTVNANLITLCASCHERRHPHMSKR